MVGKAEISDSLEWEHSNNGRFPIKPSTTGSEEEGSAGVLLSLLCT